MPMVMKNADWMRAIANASRTGGVWFQDVSSHSGTIPLEIPEEGDYQVILVKADAAKKQESVEKRDPREEYFGCKRPNVADLIGYGARFHAPRTTEEWMKELREGEED